MQLVYQGKDITDIVDIRKANIIDNSGEQLDSIVVTVNNPTNEWSHWKPQKNDTLELKKNGFTSGIMYIDEIGQEQALVTLKAIPITQEAKQPNTQSWENVRLLEVLHEFANRHNLTLKTYGIENYMYSRLNQLEQADFSFLHQRCLLEGYILKISNRNLIIFNEKHIESQDSGITITVDQCLGDFRYKDKSNDIYGACSISSSFNHTFYAPNAHGPVLKLKDLQVYSVGEAERYTRNILRHKNKYEKTLQLTKQLNTGIAAGNTIKVEEFGLADGSYYCYQLIHKLCEDKTSLNLRQILERY